jgi:LmeA-like phospholipid-binding
VARRGARSGIVLLVLLLILVGGFVVADRVAANAAANQIAAQAKKEMVARKVTSPKDPAVQIAGFPFLTQVVRGKYQKITITLDRPDINGVKLNDLKLVANTVHADARALIRGNGQVVADTVTGTASMGWDAVRPLIRLAGLPSIIDPSKLGLKVVNNQVELRVPVSVGGFNFAVLATGTIAVEAGKVRLHLNSVRSDTGETSPLIQNLINQYQDRLNVTVNVPQLPYNLVVNKIESSDAGLSMVATADQVKLASAA